MRKADLIASVFAAQSTPSVPGGSGKPAEERSPVRFAETLTASTAADVSDANLQPTRGARMNAADSG